MNDEMKQLLNRLPKKPVQDSVRAPVAPGVRGGQPLQGGPRLDLPLPAPPPPTVDQPAENQAAQNQTTAKDESHTTPGPHHAIQGQAESPQKPLKRPQADGREMKRVKSRKGDQLVAIGLKKSYQKGNHEVPVLAGVNLGVKKGEFLAIEGQSGSGKSTLLHLLGTLDAPDAGEIHFDGRRIDNQSASVRDTLRNERIGMIFQFYHLLPELTTLENVLAPLMIRHSTLSYFRHRRRHQAAATELLEMVGLGHRLKHKPRELSGGEMQRAAIARALIAKPDLLLADEPTGNLDQTTGLEILKLLGTLNQQQDLTIVMVTHDSAIAEKADRIISLVDGRIES